MTEEAPAAPHFASSAARPRRVWRRLPLSFRIGGAIVLAHLLIAALGPFLAPYGLGQMGAGIPLSGASWAHPFGLDQLGRDVFSRVLHGAWLVIMLSLSGTILGFLLGGIIGLISGYLGGRFDLVVMRIFEALISIPVLFTALLIVAMVGAKASGTLVLIVGVVGFGREAGPSASSPESISRIRRRPPSMPGRRPSSSRGRGRLALRLH